MFQAGAQIMESQTTEMAQTEQAAACSLLQQYHIS
jgi:hypothetical protein